ncbi:uncharacterized protein DUF2726 [Prosthecobacter fusiformis]|uniref:Uncharacterized protein DUF2726 n=1 Tax=Prosthecobacter fusiformis TaxID=48464 RepID=A0A4V3FF39_9BACT|nr:DUF2726 domain-containing protein [Prosthecobacter fusiformis]TDU69333.1 uncharacterized protein DUF2726 [Prosthecobacter fusiformis]
MSKILDLLAPWLPILLAAAAILMVLSAVLPWITRKRGGRGESFKYRLHDALLTAAERSFFGVLQSALSPAHLITFKVRIADVITPQKGLSGSQWQKAFNRISAKHIDFLICRADDLSPVLAIELDDASHQGEKRIQRDQMVDSALASAGLPLLRMPARKAYSPAELRQKIASILSQR